MAATASTRGEVELSPSEERDVGRAPICPHCGVTALAADTSNVLDSGFICENPDCDAFGEAVEEER